MARQVNNGRFTKFPIYVYLLAYALQTYIFEINQSLLNVGAIVPRPVPMISVTHHCCPPVERKRRFPENRYQFTSVEKYPEYFWSRTTLCRIFKKTIRII